MRRPGNGVSGRRARGRCPSAGGAGVPVGEGVIVAVGIGDSVTAVQAVKVSKVARISNCFMWCSLCARFVAVSMPRLGGGVKVGEWLFAPTQSHLMLVQTAQ